MNQQEMLSQPDTDLRQAQVRRIAVRRDRAAGGEVVVAGAKPTAGKTWHGDGIFSRPNAEGKSIYHVRVYWHGKDYVVKAGATMAQALKKGQLEHEQAERRRAWIDWIPPSQKKVIKRRRSPTARRRTCCSRPSSRRRSCPRSGT